MGVLAWLAALAAAGCTTKLTSANVKPLDPHKFAARPIVKHPCPGREMSKSSRLKGREATPAEKKKVVSGVRWKGKMPGGESSRLFRDVLQRVEARLSLSRAQVLPRLSNKTRMTYGPGHGTQIEYVAADGQNYLWYPGNRVILTGRWQACEARFEASPESGEQVVITYGMICYKYGRRTYNPVTKTRGGNWKCTPAGVSEKRIVELRSGDIFGLAGRKAPPFVLPKARTSLKLLEALMKGREQPI